MLFVAKVEDDQIRLEGEGSEGPFSRSYKEDKGGGGGLLLLLLLLLLS